jgi:Tfp pilus assembly protein PilV
MTTTAFIKEGLHAHKASAFKVVLILVAIAVFLLAVSQFSTAQHLKTEQSIQSQKALAAHTQTLDEIQSAVTQLKASNAADHTVTIKYINCVLVGITAAGANGNALPVYRTCLANSQIPGTPMN